MRGRNATHKLRRAEPDPAMRREAERIVRKACRSLPIAPPRIVWFREVGCTGSGRGCPTGWTETGRPDRIYLAVNTPPGQLREVARHECFHAAFPADESERRPERFGRGDIAPVLAHLGVRIHW